MTSNNDAGRGPGNELQAAPAASALVEFTSDMGTESVDPGHDELVLLAQLSSTNTRIANYIARVLDLDRGRIEHTKTLVESEVELAESLLALGQSVLTHARSPHRIAHRHCRPTLVEPDPGSESVGTRSGEQSEGAPCMRSS